MTGLRITLDDTLAAIRTLAITYRMPDDVTREELGRVWVDALQGIEPGELRAAVKAYIRSEARFFPKPGQLRWKAMEFRRQALAKDGRERAAPWEQTLDGPCPVCGARLRMLTPEEQGVSQVWQRGYWVPLEEAERRPPDRMGVLHDVERHKRARQPWVGYPHVLEEAAR